MAETSMPVWLFTKTAISEVLTDLTSELKMGGLELQLEDMRVLVDAGEYVLAIEQLCSHIEELNIVIPDRDYQLLAEAGSKMSMEPDTWEIIKPTNAG